MNKELPVTTIVILGVSGDLSRRKLLPSLAEICQSSDISAHLHILGVSRRVISKEEALPEEAASLSGQFATFQLDYERQEDYVRLKSKLQSMGSEQVIFYFAVPPEAVLTIVRNLGQSGMNGEHYKLLMEKPFGSDLHSATMLIEEISKHFREEQIYRIDHFLAKEMAQNIAIFLGANILFRDVWNNQFIDRIEIVAEESIGIEGRVHFYEQTGALRDIVQSHLLQLTALTLMEPCPNVFDVSMMQQRRLEALRQLRLKPGSVVRAQYDGYREEVGNPSSQVETFISLVLESSDPKWQGVPIQLLTGKRLEDKLTAIRVYFKKTQDAQANLLSIRIQPNEGIELDLWVKKPGYEHELQLLPLDFVYNRHFDRLPLAYEQVIVDAVRGRTNLFASSEEVISGWQILQPVYEAFISGNPQLRIYDPGSSAADVLV